MEYKFKLTGDELAIEEVNDFVDMYLTDTYLLSMMDNIDSSEVADIEVEVRGDEATVTVIGTIDNESGEEYAQYVIDNIIASASFNGEAGVEATINK